MKKKSTAVATKVKVGDTVQVTIRALGPNQLGVAELSSGARVFVLGGKLGASVNAEVLATQLGKGHDILARSVTAKTDPRMSGSEIAVGSMVNATIQKVGPRNSGIATLEGGMKLVIPNAANPGMTVSAQITRVKSRYAFGSVTATFTRAGNNDSFERSGSAVRLAEGNFVNLVVPTQAKRHGKYIVCKLAGQPQVLFIRLRRGARLGDRVRVKILNVGSRFAVAKVVRVSPVTLEKKQARIRQNIRQMLQSGMHFGQKAVECNARMRKYIWFRSVQNQKTDRPFTQKGRNVLNMFRTRRCLMKSLDVVSQYAAKGRTFLFVGTKKSATGLVARAAFLTKTSFFVNTRWLGGMLTNWQTIVKSIARIKPILTEKQRLIQKVLNKRQRIKARLMGQIGRTKSVPQLQALVQQAKVFLSDLARARQTKQDETTQWSNSQQALTQRASELVQVRQALIQKRIEFAHLTTVLRASRQQNVRVSADIFGRFQSHVKNFRSLSALLRVSAALRGLKAQKNVWSMSYAPFRTNEELAQKLVPSAVPNPPKQVLQSLLNFYALTNAETAKPATRMSGSASKMAAGKQSVMINKVVSLLFRSSVRAALSQKLNGLATELKGLQQQTKAVLAHDRMLSQKLSEAKAKRKQLADGIRLVEDKLASLTPHIAAHKMRYQILAAEKRFLQFLPKMRYLSSSNLELARSIQMLMKVLVDPKLKSRIARYDIYRAQANESKKAAAGRKKESLRLEKYFGGVANMVRLRQWKRHLVAVIIGQQQEMNAVRECQKLGIPTIQLVDTDGNPSLADHMIPTNDDSPNAIKFVLTQLIQRIRLAQKLRRQMAKRG